MSHVTKIELEIQDLATLQRACRRLHLEFLENQQTYTWYGRFVGDAPLPEGFTAADLGKCQHAIRVPGAAYEIGVVHRQGKYHLLWDSWHSGGLERVLGPGAGRLKQAYAIERVTQEARLKGYRLCEKQVNNSVQLVLTV
jgi:hypothetical protein